MRSSKVSLSGVSYSSSVLKVFAMLLWVCPMHAQLRGEPGISAGSYTELMDPLLQLTLCDSFYTFQLSGARFLRPLARSMGFLGVFLLVLSTAALLETSPLTSVGIECR